jgi:hypothetical protein
LDKSDRFGEGIMQEQDVYKRLADHLNKVGMGYPVRDTLLEMLEEILDPGEAEIALALPTGRIPLSPAGVDEIATRASMPRRELEPILERLAEKGFLYAGKTPSGEKGYALLHIGFGFPQTFFLERRRYSPRQKNGPAGSEIFRQTGYTGGIWERSESLQVHSRRKVDPGRLAGGLSGSAHGGRHFESKAYCRGSLSVPRRVSHGWQNLRAPYRSLHEIRRTG